MTKEKELEMLERVNEQLSELDEVQKRYEILKVKIKKHTLDAGTKTAAKHYMELAAERQAFDSEIEKLTK